MRLASLAPQVLLIPEQYDMARLLFASLLTLSFLAGLFVASPFRHVSDTQVYTISQIMLLVLFMVSNLIKQCDELPGFCERHAPPQHHPRSTSSPPCAPHSLHRFGFEDAYSLSLMLVVWNLILVVILFGLLVRSLMEAGTMPTVRLESTHEEPQLTLAKEHHYHVFLSHTWSTGQDQVAVIKRQLQHLLPGVSVFLDVDGAARPTTAAPCVAFADRSLCRRAQTYETSLTWRRT